MYDKRQSVIRRRTVPTSTFFNLPPPKREKLLHAAVVEFARRPYGEVSINRII